MEHPPGEENLFPKEDVERLAGEWDAALDSVIEAATARFGGSVSEEISRAYALERITAPHLAEKAPDARFIVISSIAGGGKSTIGSMLEELGWKRLPRVTTRAPRPGERDGHDYEFMTREAFDAANAAGEFAYVKDTYGEGRAIRISALEAVKKGEGRFYAEGDALAYHDIGSRLPEYAGVDYLSVFLLPDSLATALKRLAGRIEHDIREGTDATAAWGDAEERVTKGIGYLKESAAHVANGIYDGFLVNDDLARVRARLAELFGA